MLETTKTPEPKIMVRPTETSIGENPSKMMVDGETLAHSYLNRVRLKAEDTFYLKKNDGKYTPHSWKTAHQTILGIVQSFRRYKLDLGDSVCIMSHTRPEWLLCDIANLCYGTATVPIYPSNTPEDVAHILDNCEAKLVIVENNELLTRVNLAFEQLGKKLPVVLINDKGYTANGVEVTLYSDFIQYQDEVAAQNLLESSIARVTPSTLASIVYTSGTTGQPKGVQLTHENVIEAIRGVIAGVEFTAEDRSLLFLPLSHIFGRIESLSSILSGMTLGFAESINSIPDNLLEVKPTILVSVPRIYEKVYAKILSSIETGSPIKKKLFHWAVGVGRKTARLMSEKKPIPLSLEVQYKVADQLVFAKVRERFGGCIRLTASGGAPLNPDLCEFFHACGIKVLEGYGLTEGCPVLVNYPDNYRFGTVGLPLGDTQVRIAEDGEILLKGKILFEGYHKNEPATKAAFTEDGWYKTGDIGEFIDTGHLKITDRKKELIITAGGKNIAPQKLENAVKSSRFVSNCMTYGDQKKYISALITLDEPTTKAWAKKQGISAASFEALTKNEALIKLIEGEVATANQDLASYETIKKFRILPVDFTVETGELTPSLKVKRRVCTEKFKSYLDSMYTS